MAEKGLTNKQRVFIAEYLVDFNATRAALAAGYSKKSARFVGHENLTKPNIKIEIERHVAERCMSKYEALILLAEHARGDMGDFLTEQGELDLPSAIAAKRTKLLKKVTNRRIVRSKGKDDVTEETITSIELYDAQSALVQIGRHHKLFTDKVQVTDKDGNDIIPIVVVQPGLLDKLK